MKNKVIVLIIAGILTVGGISVAYATGRNDTTLDNSNRQMMETQNSDNKASYNYSSSMMSAENNGVQSSGRYKNMMKIMSDNGFSDEAKAMESRDFDSMSNLMKNISDADFNKMIDIMGENGYESMSNVMESIGREGMAEFHGSMMGR